MVLWTPVWCTVEGLLDVLVQAYAAALHSGRTLCVPRPLVMTSAYILMCFPPLCFDLVFPNTGALEEGTLKARPLGEVARQLNGSNELWLAAALAAPGTAELQPPQLAALCCGLVASDVRCLLTLLDV